MKPAEDGEDHCAMFFLLSSKNASKSCIRNHSRRHKYADRRIGIEIHKPRCLYRKAALEWKYAYLLYHKHHSYTISLSTQIYLIQRNKTGGPTKYDFSF